MTPVDWGIGISFVNIIAIMDTDNAYGSQQNLLLMKYGDKFESFGGQNFMVTLTDGITLFVIADDPLGSVEVTINDGGVEVDITDTYKHFYDSDPESCPVELCKWVEERFLHREVTYGFDPIYDTSCDTNEKRVEVNHHDYSIGHRVTKIYSWGNGCRLRKPEESQANFSACAITCLNRGLNLKSLTGTHRSVQECVRDSPKLKALVQEVIRRVKEDADLSVISINCTKGKHRSVAVAEILKADLFPHATVVHMELRR